VNKYKVFFLFLIVSSTLPLLAIDYTQTWTKKFATSNLDVASSVTIDSMNNIYIVGITEGSFDSNKSGVFLSKHSSTGIQLLLKQYRREKDEVPLAIVVDKDGYIYITGYYYPSGYEPGYNQYIYLRKYSQFGDELWKRELGALKYEHELVSVSWSKAIDVDSNGNIYIAGMTSGHLDGNINSGLYKSNEANTLLDAFFIKYDNNGTKIWTKQFGTSSNDDVESLTIDNNDNIYLAGMSYATIDEKNPIKTYRDGFVARFDVNGTKLWINQNTGSTDLSPSKIKSDKFGNVYTTGYVVNRLDNNQTYVGNSDAYIIKYSSSGEKIWVKQFGSKQYDKPIDIEFDGVDNVYIVGWTQGEMDYKAHNGSSEEFAKDIFLTKYSKDGEKFWTKQFGDNFNDTPVGIVIDNGNNLYIAGDTIDGSRYINNKISNIFLTKFELNEINQSSNTLSYASTNWHLISTPICKDINASELNVNVVYEYDFSLNRYFITDKIKQNIGYWVKPSSVQNISFENVIDSISKDEMFSQMKSIFKKDSWNLLGTCHLTSTTEIKERLGNEMIWSYDSNKSYYKVPQTINAGTGFWVK